MYEYHDCHAWGLSSHLLDPGTIYETWTNVSLWSFGVSAPFFSLGYTDTDTPLCLEIG